MQVTIDVGSAAKVIGIALFAAVTLGIVALLVNKVRSWWAGRAFDVHDRKAMQQRWKDIKEMSEQHGELSRKMAVIEADKLLDSALKSLAMAGDTMGERIKFAQYKYPELRQVWPAHLIRNKLAHEATYHLDAGTARRALKDFERALNRLGAL